MTAEDRKAINSFKKAVTAAKNRRKMFWRSQAPDLACSLAIALRELGRSVQDPFAGAQAVLNFYTRDEVIFDHCDDSYGSVGEVFAGVATDVFLFFATRCDDKKALVDRILQLQEGCRYSVRDSIAMTLDRFLDHEELNNSIQILLERARKGPIHPGGNRWFRIVEDIAKRTGDPVLFERTILEYMPEPFGRKWVEIAKVFFKSGDAQAAYERLQKAAACGAEREYEYGPLYRDVCRELGRKDEAEAAAWTIFRKCRTDGAIDTLLDVIGKDRRDAVIVSETELIMANDDFEAYDVSFLFEAGQSDTAQDYVFERRDKIDGSLYYTLLPLAERFQDENKPLGAVLVYRALLEANLAKAQSKYYSHGVRYLRKLDALSAQVRDWKKIEDHVEFSKRIRERHAQKVSFWMKYEKKPATRRVKGVSVE
jgi:hypothetical protein